jgi:hypothetical protein
LDGHALQRANARLRSKGFAWNTRRETEELFINGEQAGKLPSEIRSRE